MQVRLRSKFQTHTGLQIMRVMEVLPGREREVMLVVRDDTHYVRGRDKGAALKAAMRPGALDKEREPLVWVGERDEARIFSPETATR